MMWIRGMRHLLLIGLFLSFPAFGLQGAEPAPFEIREVIAEVSGELPVAEELGKVVVDQTDLESAVAEVDQYGVPRVLRKTRRICEQVSEITGRNGLEIAYGKCSNSRQ